MRVRDYGFAFVGLCLAIACGKSSSEKSNDGQTGDAGDAGEENGGTTATGGTASGGRAAGGASGAIVGGSSGAGRGGRGGTGPAGGIGGSAGEPEGGQAGEGNAGAGGDSASCTGDVGITSEEDLVAFAQRRCEVLDGGLTISSLTLTSLDALAPSTLRTITGTLTIQGNPALDNLEGFSGLEEIGHSFILQSSYMGDLGGLETLRRIGSSSDSDALIISSNPRLENVASLGGVTRLLSSVQVAQNDALLTLEGIANLTTTSNITIVNNAVLDEIGGFSDLEETQNLTISSNPWLLSASFPGLARGGSISITNSLHLESVSLPVLASAETLTIAANDSLQTVGTLDSLTSVGGLIIAGNPRLPQCFVDALGMRLGQCSMTCSGNDMNATCN